LCRFVLLSTRAKVTKPQTITWARSGLQGQLIRLTVALPLENKLAETQSFTKV